MRNRSMVVVMIPNTMMQQYGFVVATLHRTYHEVIPNEKVTCWITERQNKYKGDWS